MSYEAWRARYNAIVERLTPAIVAVRDAAARVASQRSAHGKRVDRAIDKRKAQHGGVMPTGPQPLLGVKHRALDRAELGLAETEAARAAVYDEIRELRNSDVSHRARLDAELSLCDACGVRRDDVQDDPEPEPQAPSITWQRCRACREADVEVPYTPPKRE